MLIDSDFTPHHPAELIEFARRYSPAPVQTEAAGLEALSGDAGFRRYFRLSSEPSLMLVDSPPEKEKNLEFVRVNSLLTQLGIRVPRIHAVEFRSGLMAIEDLGSRLLRDQFTPGSVEPLYNRALDILEQLQSCQLKPEWIPNYNQNQLRNEMQLFSDWFLRALLGIQPDSRQQSLISNCFDALIDNAHLQPQVLVHLDFHCRNLMLAEGDELAVIDYQDAVWGPITYDLVSLCRDCYIRWPESRIDAVVDEYADRLIRRSLLKREQRGDFRRWFDLMGLQRHIKVLGIFARLHLRDGKDRYLNDLPLVMRYTLEILQTYPKFSALHDWLVQEVIPVAATQSWYQSWRTAGDHSYPANVS